MKQATLSLLLGAVAVDARALSAQERDVVHKRQGGMGGMGGMGSGSSTSASASAAGPTYAGTIGGSGIDGVIGGLGGVLGGVVGGQPAVGGCCGKVSPPPDAAPTFSPMQPLSNLSSVSSVKLRYGPYNVTGMVNGDSGALRNHGDTDIAKPCDDCTIVGMQAGLEYANGTDANIDSGMWLHHMVHFAVGDGRTDATCVGKFSLPHLDIRSSPSASERMFSSGNERTPAVLSSTQNPAGYHLRSNDMFATIVDLMNDSMDPQVVYLTMHYDFVQGFPEGYSDVKPVWFDINQCGVSEVLPPQQEGAFTINSTAWNPNFSGTVLAAGGHMHDGGTDVQITMNGQQVCDAVAHYGGNPAYISSNMSMMNPNSATQHISEMTKCELDSGTLQQTQVQPGQSWVINANYDYSQNKGDLEANGDQEEIMGISIMYVQLPQGMSNPDAIPPGSSTSSDTADTASTTNMPERNQN